jgi:hypothetical protein
MRVSIRRPLPPTHRAAIREIFLRRRVEYTTNEAAQLLRLTLGNVIAAIESGTLHVQRRKKRKQLGGRRHALVTWEELASAAMLRWTPMEIHDALGKEANTTLPRLLRPVNLNGVRLPEYLVRLLEILAERQGMTVEAYLYTSLLALETAMNAEEIEQLLPGFREAINYPS